LSSWRETMSRYERRKILACGASCTVWEVLDMFKDELVAMKVLFPGAGFPREETLLASKVTHPNVCRIYDCFYDEQGSACITMELVDGGTLQDFLDDPKRFHRTNARLCFSNCCRALP